MREIFETEEDRENEEKIITAASELWNCQFVKLNPAQYVVDYATHEHGGVTGFVEVKRRHMKWEGLDSAWISYSKWIAGTKLVESTPELRFSIIWAFDDTEVFFKWNGMMQFPVEIKGRNKPRDEFDTEPMVLVPRNWIRTLKLF
jgi:hypothetical protein